MSNYHITPEESIRLNACRWLSINDGVVSNYRQAPEGSETEMLADLTAGDVVYTIGYNKLDLAELIGGYSFVDSPVVIEGEITTDSLVETFLAKYSLPIRSDMFRDLVTDGVGKYTLTVQDDLFIKGSLQVAVMSLEEYMRPDFEYMLNGTMKQTGKSDTQINIPVVYAEVVPGRIMAKFQTEDGKSLGTAVGLDYTLELKDDWTLCVVIESLPAYSATSDTLLNSGILSSIGLAGDNFMVRDGKILLSKFSSYNVAPENMIYYKRGPYVLILTRVNGDISFYVNGIKVITREDKTDRFLNTIYPSGQTMLHGLRFFKYGTKDADIPKMLANAYRGGEHRYLRPMYEWKLETDSKNSGTLTNTAALGTFQYVEHEGFKLAKWVNTSSGFQTFYLPAGGSFAATFAVDVWFNEIDTPMGFFTTSFVGNSGGSLSNPYANLFLYDGLYLRSNIKDTLGLVICTTTDLPNTPTIFTDKPNRLVLVKRSHDESIAYINGTPVRRYEYKKYLSQSQYDATITQENMRYVSAFGNCRDYETYRLSTQLMFKNLQFFAYPMTDEQVLKHYNDEPYDPPF